MSSTFFTCPECGRKVEAAAAPAGRPPRCPNCAAGVRAPGKSSGRRRGPVILGIVLALAAAAGVGIFVYRHFAGDGPDAANPYLEAALPPGYRPTLKIPLPKMPPASFHTVLYPNQPSSFVLVKRELWDVKAGQKVGAIEYKIGPGALQALAADGKHLAVAGEGRVRILAVPGGQEVFRVDYSKGQGNLSFVGFATPERLVVGMPNGTVASREVPSGKELGAFKAEHFLPQDAALSPNGTRLAIFRTDGLTVHELPSGKPLFQWLWPAKKYKSLPMATGLSFSPDGKELAVLCSLGGPSLLLCWDLNAGKLSGEFPVSPALNTPGAGSVGYRGAVVQWLPDGAGWLLNGHVLFHRPSGRIAWILRTRAPWVNTVAVLNKDRLLAPVVEGEQEYLIDIPVPWPALETGVKALTAQAASPLRPGQAVSVQVDVGALRLAEPAQILTELRQALTDRLAADGIPVADNQPTVVYARYQEAAGQKLQVYEFAPLQPQRNPPTTAEETTMALEIGIRAKEGADPLWRTYLRQGAGLIVSGKGTTRDVHRDTLNRLKMSLKNAPLPYFIPADDKTPRLPLVSQL